MFSRREHHHHHHHGYQGHYRSRQADTGAFLMFAGLLLGSPFLFILGYFEYMTAPMLVAASTTTFLGLSTLSLSGLIVYGSIGVAYMFSGARECYNSDQGPLDLLKSRITNNGLVSTIGAILWSPFLFVGGVAGATAKAVANTFSSKPSTKGTGSSSDTASLDDEESDEESDLLAATHSSQHVHSSDEEETFESPQSPLPHIDEETKKDVDTTHSGESVVPTTGFRLPLSKSQEILPSYSKMSLGLDVKPSEPRDDSRLDSMPVVGTNPLRQSQHDAPVQELEQQPESPRLK